MAGNPTSKGVGSGTAVLHDYSIINNATSKLFDNLRADRDAGEKKKDAAKAKQEAAEKQLRGDLGDYDSTKIKESDREVALEMFLALKKKTNGRNADLINGDPEVSNQYARDKGEFKNFLSNSADSKTEFMAQTKAMNEPNSGFSAEKKAEANKFMTTPGSTVDQAKEQGLFTRDRARNGHLENLKKTFKDSWIKKDGYKQLNDDGTSYGHVKATQIPAEESLELFKSYATANPEVIQDMIICLLYTSPSPRD